MPDISCRAWSSSASASRVTSGSLALLGAVTLHPSRLVEVSVLVVANLAATVLRFVLLREWVFTTRKAIR